MAISVRMAALGVLLCGGLAGCEEAYPTSAIQPVVPVSGVVTWQNKPLEYFQVTLLPDDGGRAAVGVTDAEGKFTLGTNKLGDGAAAGPCKLAVVFVGPPSANADGLEEGIDDPRKLPKPSVKIPAKYSNPETSGLAETIPPRGTSELKLSLE